MEEFRVPVPAHRNNGDEELYPNRIGNYSKGLPHNRFGEVDSHAYQSLIHALQTRDPGDFEEIVMGGNVPLVNPQAGLAFDMEGTDSHQMALGPPPRLASAERAGEAVECYWMALLRDVNFTHYAGAPLALEAADELSRMSDFRGPKENGRVTPRTLFRGFTAGDLIGPYVSQFLLKTVDFGAVTVEQKFNTYTRGTDYMTDAALWLAVQDGRGPFADNQIDPRPRHIRNGRDLSAYVHVDVLFEAYFNACLWLIDNGAPLNRGNPYFNRSRTQAGFGTFGPPHVKALLAEVATRALKAVWFQKWFVHRALRPEEFGGLVHFTKTGEASYPLHSDVLDSQAVVRISQANRTYFLPHAFPEGCPQHPSYGQGHGTVAGACATIVKAFFDDSFALSEITDIVQAAEDGFSLVPYGGGDVGQITVGGEMNKIAANVGIGRNHAAVHWRSDYADSLLLGEAVAISVLRDQKSCYNELFDGFTFTKFDGTTVTV
ncbi:MAG TPA: vanadium-dependent haloperoxidase [Myxococcaceae bacterium]|nr:vanadium-dependent haloperoxidase [Myxococcaceae bacterium]